MKRNLMGEILTSFLLVIKINGNLYVKQNLGVGANSQPYNLGFPEESSPVHYNDIESDGVHKSDSSGSQIVKNVYFFADSQHDDEPVRQNVNKIKVIAPSPTSYKVILVKIPAEWVGVAVEKETRKVNVILQEATNNVLIESTPKNVYSGRTLGINQYSNYEVANSAEQYVRMQATDDQNNIFQHQQLKISNIALGINALAEFHNKHIEVPNYQNAQVLKTIRYTNVVYKYR